MEKKKIFISYSWSPDDNAHWVREFARRLTSDGIHVVLDVWDLSEGQDKYVFMEKMVSDEEIDKVLLICNETYASKANLRKGGVGDESMIITPEIYGDVNQKKFIPVVNERDKSGNPFLPSFIASRLYVDLSEGESFEDNYEKLIRLIYDKPAEKRPPLGTPPAYVYEDESVHIKTYYLLNPIKNALNKNSGTARSLIADYYKQFLDTLDEFIVEEKDSYSETNNNDLDNLYYVEIAGMEELMNAYKAFLKVIVKYSNFFDIEELKLFLEKVLEYHFRYKERKFTKPVTRLTGSHVSFIRYELFLNTIAILMESGLYEDIGQLLSNPYYIKKNPHDTIKPYHFNLYYFPSDFFAYRNQHRKLNRVNLRADMIKSRTANDKEFSLLQEADLVLFYRSLLDSVSEREFHYQGYKYWHPDLSVYYLNGVPTLERLISKKFFEKFKSVFSVDSKDELFSLIEKLGDNSGGGVRMFHYNAPNIKSMLMNEEICKYS